MVRDKFVDDHILAAGLGASLLGLLSAVGILHYQQRREAAAKK